MEPRKHARTARPSDTERVEGRGSRVEGPESGVRCQVSGVRCQVSGVRCQVRTCPSGVIAREKGLDASQYMCASTKSKATVGSATCSSALPRLEAVFHISLTPET